jgi:uncharacterized protein
MREAGKLVTLGMLRAYKWAISPLFPPSCRYVPTCSEYAMEAVERFGAVRGMLMAAARLLRCHPFARGGYDPVVSDGKRHTSGVKARTHFRGVDGTSGTPALPGSTGARFVSRLLKPSPFKVGTET